MKSNVQKSERTTKKPKLDYPSTAKGVKVDLNYFRQLYKDDKTKKFYLHLIRAFCNSRNVTISVDNPEKLKCAILGNVCTTPVKSILSNLVLDKSVYDVLIRHIMTMCFTSKTVKFIVQDAKLELLRQDLRKLLELDKDAPLVYDDLQNYSSNIRHAVVKMMHLHDVYCYHNGRMKYAYRILNRELPIPLPNDEPVRIEHPLIFMRMVPKDLTGNSTSTILGDLLKAKLDESKNSKKKK